MAKADRDHLTLKQTRFVEHYIASANATTAARAAGYKGSRKTLGAVGAENLAKPHVRRAVELSLARYAETVPENAGRIAEAVERFRRGTRALPDVRVGVVYILRSDNGLVKIGRAVDFEARLRSLNTMLPYELTILHVFESSRCTALESWLHRMHAAERVKGEWFRLTGEQVAALPAMVGAWHDR